MGFPTPATTIYGAWTQAGEGMADLEARLEVSVKDSVYAGGAIGDFVHDDTAAFQAALTAVAAAGGGIVRVPRGVYKITANLVFGSFTTLRGTGPKSIIRTTTANIAALFATGQSFCAVEDLALDGNALGSIGVLFNASPNSTVRRCRITGFTGLLAGSLYGGGVHMYLSDDCTIEDNDFSGNGVLVGGLTSDIQINGNGAVADCNKRIKMHNNRCLSTAVQTNIVAYDVAYSSATENMCSGAKTQATNNNGYAIAFYRTVLANPGTARRNRVENNLVWSVDGTAIYMQAQNDCAVVGNVIEDAGAVQSDITLQVGAIVFSNSPRATCTGNSIFDCKKTGIVMGGTAGNVFGFTITANEIDTITLGSASSPTAIKVNGDLKNSVISGNTIRNVGIAIGTPPVDQGAVGNVIAGNAIETTTDTRAAIEFYGLSRSAITSNRITGSNREGIALVGGSSNVIASNEIWDGSVAADNTFAAININSTPDCLVIGNIGGNTGGVGYKYFVLVAAASPRTVVTGNKARAARTANFNVDTTFANQSTMFGNFDDSVTNPQIFPIRQQAVLQGAANNMVQLLLGDSSSYGAVGTRWSGADTFLVQNASHVQGSDLWHQSNAAAASKLLILRSNGDLEFYSTVLGTADATFATFWGAAKAAFGAASTVKLAGTQVVKVQQAAVADVASANASDLATAITLANELKTQVNLLLNRVRAATGHGLIA